MADVHTSGALTLSEGTSNYSCEAATLCSRT
jgi:hypothetical protein